MPTFLEYLWASLYAAEAARQYAAYAASGLLITTMSVSARQAIADQAAAFADDMVARTPGTTLADLQTAISDLKP